MSFLIFSTFISFLITIFLILFFLLFPKIPLKISFHSLCASSHNCYFVEVVKFKLLKKKKAYGNDLHALLSASPWNSGFSGDFLCIPDHDFLVSSMICTILRGSRQPYFANVKNSAYVVHFFSGTIYSRGMDEDNRIRNCNK